MLLSTRLDAIDSYYGKPANLDDLFFYDSVSNDDATRMTIDTGDFIYIQCTDGIYRTGEVYSYGMTYCRIIVNNRFYTAVMTDDAELKLRTADNQYAENTENIIQFIQEQTYAPAFQGAAS